MTDDDARGMGLKLKFLDDVICERPLMQHVATQRTEKDDV